jgi:DNA-binding FadR family transcriptional regulator
MNCSFNHTKRIAMSLDLNARAADAIVSKLESQIVSGHLRDKGPLPVERELMEQFGASRTVVREAISMLSSRGLVECKPRFRPIVRKPDYATVLNATGNVVRHLLNEPGGVKNLYTTRVFMECGLVRQAAISATKEDIGDLRVAIEANENAINDSDEFYRTDNAFHGVLYKIPRNPVFPAVHEGFTSWLAPQWAVMLRSPERNLANFQSHKAILDAILERDPDAAEAALNSHLTAAWEYVRVTFDVDQA